MARILAIAFGSAAATYLVFLVWIYFTQRSLEYFPSRHDREGRGNATLNPWRDGGGVFLGYQRAVPNPRGVFLFFHGNGGEALDREWFLAAVPRDVVFLLAEYPGYGAMAGETTQESIFAAAERAFDAAHQTWKLPVTALGESLGSGAACYLASRRPVARLALISPFSSAVDVAAIHYPFLPTGLLMLDRFPSTDYIQSVRVPLHVVHGTKDDVIPISLARKLFDAYPGADKTFTELPGVGHNDFHPAVLASPPAAPFRQFLAQ